MAILLKACKPDNFESHNSLKFSFTNIWGLCSNSVDCASFLESNCSDILALHETNLHGSIDSGNFTVTLYLPLIGKDPSTYSYAWSCSLCEGRTCFCVWDLSLGNCRFLIKYLTGFTLLSVLLLFPLLITFFVFVHGF